MFACPSLTSRLCDASRGRRMRRRPRESCASEPRRRGFVGAWVGAAGQRTRLRAHGYPRFHCWLLPPLQVHSSTSAPSAVDAPVTSRQSPDCAPVMVPLELKFHCWLLWPLQGQMITFVPLVVPWPLASRQSVVPLLVTVSWFEEVRVQVWFACPLQP